MTQSVENVSALVHPHQLEVQDWSTYALVIDARSPHEYADDHIPGAVNLPVVDDAEYAEVGTTHRTDKHSAYLIGVEYSLRNIAAQIKPLISRYTPADRFLALLLPRRQSAVGCGPTTCAPSASRWMCWLAVGRTTGVG